MTPELKVLNSWKLRGLSHVSNMTRNRSVIMGSRSFPNGAVMVVLRETSFWQKGKVLV